MPSVQRKHNVVTTVEALDQLVDEYLAEDAFAFDVETLPGPGGAPRTDVRRNTVAWLSLSTYGRADVIPLGHPHGELESIEYPLTAGGKARKALWEAEGKAEKWKPRKAEISNDARKATHHWSPAPEQLDIHEAFGHLKRLLLSDRTKIGHNLKFDLCSVEKYLGEFPAAPYFDTMVAAYLLDSGHFPIKGYPRPYALNAVCKREVGYDMVKGVGAEIEAHGFATVARYSWVDSRFTWLAYRRLVRQLKRDGLSPLMALEMDVLEVLCHMEKHGAHIDPAALAELDKTLDAKVQLARQAVEDMAPKGFNVDSTPQKQKLLYDPKPTGRGLKPKAYTKTGAPSVAAESLEPYRNRDKLVGALLDYADLAKLHGTYVQAYARTGPEKRGSKTYYPLVVDGRIHADFNQIGAATGRLSCREPNLQNVPSSGTENGKAIRSLFVAPEGHALVVADYSQIEPRVIASFSGDQTMVDAYRNGEDIYTAIAAPLGLDRKAGKTLVLALGYGIGADSVADRLDVGLRKAQKIMSDFDERFSAIARYKAQVIKEARRQRPPHVTTLYGRRRFLFDLWSDHPGKRAAAERQAFNTKIQGSAADLIKVAMVRAHRTLPEGCHLILSVHDELVTVAPEHLVEQATEAIRAAMEDIEIPGFLVPLVADIHAVQRWANAK